MFLPAETQAGSVMGWHAGIGSVTAGEVGCALAGRGGNLGEPQPASSGEARLWALARLLSGESALAGTMRADP